MDIEKEILQIKERNQRVEQDKAWEKSWFRRISIAALTYLVAAVWLIVIADTLPWLKALVPPAGYLLSTLSMGWIKNYWTSHRIHGN